MFFRLHLIRIGASVRSRTDAPTALSIPDRTARHRSQSRVGVRLVCPHRRRVQRRARDRDDRRGDRRRTAAGHRFGRAIGRFRNRRRRSHRSVGRRPMAPRVVSPTRSSAVDRRPEPPQPAAEGALSLGPFEGVAARHERHSAVWPATPLRPAAPSPRRSRRERSRCTHTDSSRFRSP